MSAEAEPLRYTGHLLRRAQQMHAAAWIRDVSSDTTSVQFAALTVLDREGQASQQQLCRALDLDRSTIADLVARMVRRGLLERERDRRDRRRNVVRLTAEGRVALAFLRPRVEAIEPVVTGGLGAAERGELRRLLKVVIAHAAADGLLAFEPDDVSPEPSDISPVP